MDNTRANMSAETSIVSLVVLIVSVVFTGSVSAVPTEQPQPSLVPPPPTSEVGVARPGLSFITLNDLPAEIRDRAISVNDEYKKNGFRLVPDAEIERYSIQSLARAFQPNTVDILNRMPNELARLVRNGSAHSLTKGDTIETSEYGKVTLEGVIAGYTPAGGSLLSITRVFQAKDRSSMLLSAIDIGSNVAGTAVPIEAINSNVKGYPAILNLLKSESGKYVVTLSWFTETTQYTLFKTGHKNVEVAKNDILALAEKLE